LVNSLKTANAKVDELGETSGGVRGELALATHVSRSRGKKWETEKEKHNGTAAKMMEKWKDVMTKNAMSPRRKRRMWGFESSC
jgi:hypothetical protein